MTSGMLDSKPVFLARIQAAGLSDDAQQRLIDGGIDTLAKLAFIAPVSPTSGDDTILITELCAVMTYSDATPMPTITKSILRRIWFEAHATAISEVKNRMEGNEAQTRKLPMPEREDRRAKQQLKITGFKIEGVHEPSNSLIDLVHTMKEDEQLRYISPEQCTHREAEMHGIKKETFMQPDTGGRLKQVNRDVPLEADVSNSYKLRLSLQRRALALDQMDLAQFQTMEDYHEYLFDLLLQPVSTGYAQISVPQILNADKLVWNYMASNCRTGISRRPDGSLPLELALAQALRSPIVISALQPLPKSGGSPNTRGKGQSFGNEGKGNNFRKHNNYVSEPYQPKGKSSGKGGKGKNNKGKGKITPQMPKALMGGKHTSKDGLRICYGYNLGSCQACQPGSSCSRGLHVCCGCESAEHTYMNCPRKA